MKYTRKPVEVDAYQFLQGVSGYALLSQKYPDCSIGVPWDIHNDVCLDDTDIRWFHVWDGDSYLAVDDGDWIVKFPDGRLEVVEEHDFQTQYEPSERYLDLSDRLSRAESEAARLRDHISSKTLL